MLTLYNVISSDGYIARENGDEDFIPDNLWPSTLKFFEKHDALIMSRKTHDAMQKYDRTLLVPFEALSLKKIIITRVEDYVPKSGYTAALTMHAALALAPGPTVLASIGHKFNSALIREYKVDRVIWHVVPQKIGGGIKPFDTNPESFLVLMNEQTGPLGTKFLVYRVINH